MQNSELVSILGVSAARAFQGKRISDRILQAFHQACDQNDLDVAGQLLKIVDFMAIRWRASTKKPDRRNMESVVAAHERLWHLRRATEAAAPPALLPVQVFSD